VPAEASYTSALLMPTLEAPRPPMSMNCVPEMGPKTPK
jgi:hypothetical protein